MKNIIQSRLITGIMLLSINAWGNENLEVPEPLKNQQIRRTKQVKEGERSIHYDTQTGSGKIICRGPNYVCYTIDANGNIHLPAINGGEESTIYIQGYEETDDGILFW